ncbi:hypothetical protein HY495_02590 [Candidatus Woesearchaeota archaeon]|nr:hypothetical protein [Candidatus Woesearchaeota archaeon]
MALWLSKKKKRSESMKKRFGRNVLQRGNRQFHQRIFWVLLAIVLILAVFSLLKAMGLLIPAQPTPLIIENTIDLASLSLDQKIAQMIIVAGQKWNLQAWTRMQLGGIHLYAKANENIFQETVSQFQEKMVIPFFVTLDLEGCQNPFAAFKNFTAASEITTPDAALKKGGEEGAYLSTLGITVNFAPVVDLEDTIWKCRSFPGEPEMIATLAEAYVSGLQKENILATAKHFPGKTLVVQDPHKYLVAANISTADLLPYRRLSSSVKAIMISHVISSGSVDSQGIPAAASSEAVLILREGFDGLIITDEVNMLGLKKFYPTLDEMYLAVFKAGNDVILNFNEDPHEIQRMITVIKKAVERGEIPEERIDASVRRILQAKGFNVS